MLITYPRSDHFLEARAEILSFYFEKKIFRDFLTFNQPHKAAGWRLLQCRRSDYLLSQAGNSNSHILARMTHCRSSAESDFRGANFCKNKFELYWGLFHLYCKLLWIIWLLILLLIYSQRWQKLQAYEATGKSFSEALILKSINPQYDERLFWMSKQKTMFVHNMFWAWNFLV